MPTYCYRTKKGTLVELVMTNAEREERETDGEIVLPGGKKAYRDMVTELNGTKQTCNWSTPLESISLAVHPTQIPEFRKIDREHGLNIDYTTDGSPRLTREKQRRQYCRAHGYHQNNAFFG